MGNVLVNIQLPANMAAPYLYMEIFQSSKRLTLEFDDVLAGNFRKVRENTPRFKF